VAPPGTGSYDAEGPTTEVDAEGVPALEPNELVERLQAQLDEAGVRYFNAAELIYLPKLDRFAGNREVDPNIFRNLVAVARVADYVRGELGLPLNVVSAYRPREYNALVNGSARSQHLLGKALDLNLVEQDRTPEKIDRLRHIVVRLWAQRVMGFGGLGLYERPTYRIHVDVGPHVSWRRGEVDPILDQLRASGEI
jgi:uncharacterized protein YcbK (DUF882 family)